MQHDNKSFQSKLVSGDSIWIVGATGSGKTACLIEQFEAWAETPRTWQLQPTCLVFSAIGDNRLTLLDRISTATQARYPFDAVTPIGFFQSEVLLFWPLLMQQLGCQSQFPLRLRPETEQALATWLWQPAIASGRLHQTGVNDYFIVRRTLDLLQLAAASGTPHEQLPLILQEGFTDQVGPPELWDCMGEVLEHWWQWCLERGLLTYGILTELYWRYLLPQPTYQQHLQQRYRAVLVDDVDEYPAAARLLFEFFLDQQIPIAFTFNPVGAIRLGLGADPSHLAQLAQRCRVESLPSMSDQNLGTAWGQTVVDCIHNPLLLPELPHVIQVIQTVSKAQLLRQTAETIATAIQSGRVEPQEIAVVSPNLDSITRYTLQEILASQGIPLISLNAQQPLISSPLVRALLTLLALVYPDLGYLVDRESVAEMLVILSQAKMDPVRAGLLTDYCFVPNRTTPCLLPITQFPRWDRLGHQASQAYSNLLQWLDVQRNQQQQHLLSNPVVLLDRAIQRFLAGGSELSYDKLTILRELMETAQHYWEVEARLQQFERSEQSVTTTVGQFIQLLRDGTITADPYPVRPAGKASQSVTLASIYQYRRARCHHRWQFWFDAGSAFWATGGRTLFGAPLLLRDRPNRVWTATDELAANQDYLEREVIDLLSRVTERVYLCHCDLAVNGQEQSGALMPLINAALPASEGALSDPGLHQPQQRL